jgi:hypothetical protein
MRGQPARDIVPIASYIAALILQAVSIDYLYGFSVMEQIRIPSPSGTVYPHYVYEPISSDPIAL